MNINDFIKKHAGSMTDKDMLLALSKQGVELSLNALQRRRQRLDIKQTPESIEKNTPSDADLTMLKELCITNNLPFERWKMWWWKVPEHSICFQNQEAIEKEQKFYSQLVEDVKKHAPKYAKRKSKTTGEHMLVLPQADIHIGKWASEEETGSTFNSAKAVRRVKEGTAELVAKGALFGVKSYVVCLGNDMLHTDNGKTTTSGTPQDTDGSWFHNFRLARDLYVAMIEELAADADVYLVFVPSNHDWRSGFALSEVVAAYFSKHPNVTSMTTERHRKYLVFGQNLIMFTHGDGAKEKDLHWLLATEASQAWSKTKFRYVYLGHLHHKIRKVAGHQNAQTEKDRIGFTELDVSVVGEPDRDVNIEYVRSSSGTDGWHDRNGYISKPAMEAFLHHPEAGQIARFTHWF